MTCSFCKSSLLRNGVDWERYGEIGELMPEESVLQLGTQVEWNKTQYTLTGRIQRRWERGTWSEWLMFGGDAPLWLSFAQGEYAVTREVDGTPSKKSWGELQVGTSVTVGLHGTFTVLDKKEVSIAAIEGELPFPVKIGDASKTADGRNIAGQFLTLEWESGSKISCYVGQPAFFDQLHLRNMRRLDGW